MQYANITVSDLNRVDFVSQRELSQQELSLAGGWGGYFGGFGSFAQANSSAQAVNFGFGSAIANSSAQAINFGFSGGAIANSSASAISGAGFAKHW